MTKKYFQFVYPHPDDKDWVVFLYRNQRGFFTIRGARSIEEFDKIERKFTKEILRENYDIIERKINELETVRRGSIAGMEWYKIVVKMREDLSQFGIQEW